MLFPDSLSVTFGQRRCVCVMDPALMLSRFGLPLLRRLGDAMELWVVRELWHILDNSRVYLDDPALLFRFADGPAAYKPPEKPAGHEEITTAMRDWERIRLENDLSGLRMCWLGDGVSESLMPTGARPDLLTRFDAFGCTLDRALRPASPMECAYRDSAALAAALGNAFILTSFRSVPEPGVASPALRDLLARGGIACTELPLREPLAEIERDYLRRLLVHANVAKLVWAGLSLAVIHVVTPAGMFLYDERGDEPQDPLDGILPATPDDELRPGLWDGAQAFWYTLARPHDGIVGNAARRKPSPSA
ncbi:hypothetical protein [Caballeronia grimmiae]|uniref:hypothetical protein n=1 Tax=Caballeronia grimmiae TaxID=1071679 RepID=UPI0038B7854A